jgi:DnaK suppressor protein
VSARIPSPGLATLRKQLRARAETLAAEVRRHRQQLVEPDSATGNTFIAGSEGAAAQAEDEREATLLTRALLELDAANAALQRIDRGDFGVCERCGNDIAWKRLEAVPDARQCLDCQRESERA